jgi:hypothetical protein
VTDKNYSWERLWRLRSSVDEVFREDPLSGYDVTWLSSNFPNLEVPFEKIADISCLVLLGELGIGKSRELQWQAAYTYEQLSERTLLFDLSGFQSEPELRRALVDDPIFQAWIQGTYPLYLFLDSFDEGPLAIPVLSKLLLSIFTKYQAHLHLCWLLGTSVQKTSRFLRTDVPSSQHSTP